MTAPRTDAAERRSAVVIAGHNDDTTFVLDHVDDPDPAVRGAALGALERIGVLDDDVITAALRDPDVGVRRRAVSLAATHVDVDLVPALADEDPRVVEVAAWACGEHESNRDAVIEKLIELGGNADEPLVRESSVAALGAIGDDRGLDTIVTACADKPAVRRRAVLALAPFIDHPDHSDLVDSTIESALSDRDWQVRQAAEDLRRITGDVVLDEDDDVDIAE